MNKKGFFSLYLFGVLAIILVIMGIIFYFSSTFRYLVLGVGLGIMSFVVLLKANIKNERAKLGIFFVLLIGGMVLIFSSGVLQTITSDSHIEAPFFGTVKCDRQAGGLIESGSINLRNDLQGFTRVSPPQNLESYDVLLSHEGEDSFGESYRWTASICDINGNTCTNIQADYIPSFGLHDQVIQTNVPRDKYVFLTIERRYLLGSWNKVQEGSYKLRYQPYILFVTNSLEGGTNPISGSTDCKMPSTNLKDNAILSSTVEGEDGSSFDSKIPLYRNYLEPNENYNFLAGTVTRASFGNTIEYNGKTGYCAENIQGVGAVIYKIGEIKTLTRTYSVVDMYGTPLKVLGFDGCCVENRVEGSRVCKDFQWEEVVQDEDTGETNVECSFLNPCNVGRFILGDGTKTYEYKCIDGQCIISNIQEEDCITNTDCKGDNEICVNYECIQASTIPEPTTSDDSTCAWYEQEATVTEKDYGLLYWKAYVPFVDPTETEVQECRLASWVSPVLIALVVLILGFFAISLTIKPKRKRK